MSKEKRQKKYYDSGTPREVFSLAVKLSDEFTISRRYNSS